MTIKDGTSDDMAIESVSVIAFNGAHTQGICLTTRSIVVFVIHPSLTCHCDPLEDQQPSSYLHQERQKCNYEPFVASTIFSNAPFTAAKASSCTSGIVPPTSTFKQSVSSELGSSSTWN